jgi:hypothetical protein
MVWHIKFLAAWAAAQASAHHFLSRGKPLDFKQERSGQSELKILVSVVRFRPRPPIKPAWVLGTTLFKR